MEVDINDEELRDLVKKTLKLSEENNKILRGIRSSARWGRFFSLAWWIIIIAVSAASYYYYVQPYVETIQQAYGNTQNFQQQFQQFFSQFGNQRP
jgi:hypothetical protein